MKMIFLSYSHADIEFARKLYQKLSVGNIKVWFDEQETIWGSTLIDETQKALYNSSVVITIISSKSKSSQWKAFEVGAARAMGKIIIPILLSVEYDMIPLHLKDLQVIDAQNKSIDEITTIILNILNREEITLTKREMDVFKLIANGYTSSKIAEKLDIGKRTVDAIRSNILKKMEIKSLSELNQKAVRHSITDENSN